MNNSRLFAVIKKEFKHLFRDIRMLLVLLIFPVFLLGIFGYAINFDVKNIQLAVYDQDNSKESREFISNLTNSGYFKIVNYVSKDSEIKNILDKQQAQLVLKIPSDFSKNLAAKSEDAKVQFLIDGVNGNTAIIIFNYVNAATQFYNLKIQEDFLAQYGQKLFFPIDLEAIFWFNPNLESTKFLIPGLIAMILIVTAVISISLSIVREKERNTIEQIQVSSLTNLEMIIGKSIPYVILALVEAVFILIAGYFLFAIEVKGDIFLLFISTLIFIIAATSIGIFISAISDSQQVAFMMATFISLLPSIILSGFIFPIEGMPYIIQLITNLTPAKFFVNILRAIILRGVGFEAIWQQLIYLTIFIILFLVAATAINKKKMESA